MDASTTQPAVVSPTPADVDDTQESSPLLVALAAIERSVSTLRLLSLLAVVAALWYGQVVLIPIVLSVLLSYALEPLVARLESRRVPRAIAVPLMMALLLTTTGLAGYGLRGEATA